jgi:hexosaminidase
MTMLSIIPKPMEVSSSDGTFLITSATRIVVDKNAEQVAAFLKDLLSSTMDLKVELVESPAESAGPDTILLALSDSDDALGPEGYELHVTPAGTTVRAPRAAGLFYGVQTFRQLLPPDVEKRESTSATLEIPAVAIKDKPRFAWRGLHLDVGRHFFPISFVKKYIDLLALHKMNVFHWHLTEDQGWRIEIKKYPKLTEIGSKRKASPLAADRYTVDGIPYEGFYTQDEIREVVEHAESRFVQVLPEIEMPGHTVSALAAYPELGCTGGPYKVRAFWGIEEDVYCAGSEKVFEFLEDVLTEVMALFPGRYIHIGGDESPKASWRKCEKCQKRIAEERLKNEDELQSYFIRRIENFLTANGRRLIGWDEILEGGLAPDATVMSWRGMGGGIEAASQGHDVVMCPLNYTYFDYYQSEDHKSEPPAIGGLTPLETVYELDPVSTELSEDAAKHILGAQGQLWTEFIAEEDHLEYMAYPRACALAEVLWTNKGLCDYGDFIERLSSHLQRLKNLNVNFRNPL